MHPRPAASSVGDNGIDIIGENGDILPSQLLRLLGCATVEQNRAAAALAWGNDRFYAVGRQHAQRCPVDVGVEDALDAA